MKLTKAVITAAGADQRMLPAQTLVDRDGRRKTALRVLAEEILSAGIDEIAVIVHPGDADVFAQLAAGCRARMTFVEQTQPRGYGHALHCARDFVGGESFLHLISDHLYVSLRPDRSCARQLVEVAEAEDCAVSAVQATRESMLPFYGVIGGRRVPQSPDRYVVDQVREKPDPTQAEQELQVPGLRAGHYLCFFGMHVLTPFVMEELGRLLEETPPGRPVPLSPALARLAARERYLALELAGRRYDMGECYGLFYAQLALILESPEREDVLARMVELLAQRELGRGVPPA